MQIIEWDVSYEIGIEEVDQQHRQLVVIINQLFDAIVNSAPEEMLKSIFNQVLDYTGYHFVCEEKYIVQLTRKDKRLHILQHQNFIEELNCIQRLGVNQQTAEQVWYFLADWLITHIVSEDIKAK